MSVIIIMSCPCMMADFLPRLWFVLIRSSNKHFWIRTWLNETYELVSFDHTAALRLQAPWLTKQMLRSWPEWACAMASMEPYCLDQYRAWSMTLGQHHAVSNPSICAEHCHIWDGLLIRTKQSSRALKHFTVKSCMNILHCGLFSTPECLHQGVYREQ